MPNTVPVKYFNSDMTGAPQLTGQAGSEVALLRACLITGFDPKTVTITQTGGTATVTCNGHGRKVNEVVLHSGANESGYNGEFRIIEAATNYFKVLVDPATPSPATGTITCKLAPAGWSELFAPGQSGNVANVGVFRPAIPHPQNVLQTLDNSPGTSSGKWSRWRGYENMVDAVTGTGLFPDSSSTIGLINNKSSTADSTARSWDLIADDGIFFLHTAWNPSYLGEYDLSFFGDAGSTKSGDAYCSIVSAAYAEGQSNLGVNIDYSMNYVLTPGNNLGHFIARHWNQTGGARIVGFVGDPGISIYSGSGGLSSSGNPPNNGLYWAGISVVHNGAIRTKQLPGILQYLHNRNYSHRELIVNPPGLTGHTLIALRANYASSSGSGMFLYDMTGPWTRDDPNS